jgi:TBC1 domain family member 8/9
MRSPSSTSPTVPEKEKSKTLPPPPSLHLTANPDLEAKSPGSEAEIFSPMNKVQAANAALLARPSFTIDDAKDDEDDADATSDAGADDDQVMDEVGGLVLWLPMSVLM